MSSVRVSACVNGDRGELMVQSDVGNAKGSGEDKSKCLYKALVTRNKLIDF